MSRTIQIPGGTAELFDRDELTPRRTIPYQALLYRADKLMEKLANARRVVSVSGEVEENPDLDGPEHRLTPHEAETLEYLQLANDWGWLKSWSLDIPLPATWEGLLDIPNKVTNAIHAAIVEAANPVPEVASEFEMTEETLEDKQSFTGAGGGSKTQSEAPAKRRKSTPKTSTS
ncbi:hypothetical protein [Arthrobacter bambusae]|uniref:hypothetical protein n=1 Tax=Arthrobacter bambusae TaxID=1338426 RepID=UPI00277D5CF1|nr:hypothetical protein [Arthrobacter bambusae]MDQ0241161.1 hypothetical protein [Arthrobacter bambusae]